MVLRVGVEKPPDHSLILGVVLPRLAFKELDAPLAQRDGDLDPVVPQDEVLGTRKEIRDDLKAPEGLVSVSDFPALRGSQEVCEGVGTHAD